MWHCKLKILKEILKDEMMWHVCNSLARALTNRCGSSYRPYLVSFLTRAIRVQWRGHFCIMVVCTFPLGTFVSTLAILKPNEAAGYCFSISPDYHFRKQGMVV